jgi:hypothetical protein
MIRIRLFENYTINTILDKISKNGIESLTDFEKKILGDSSEYSIIEDDTTKWLNSKYKNLNIIEDTRKSFGINKDYILFLDDDMELVMEYDKKSKVLYISYEDLQSELGEHFNGKTFSKWFQDNYNIAIRKISNFFGNVE